MQVASSVAITGQTNSEDQLRLKQTNAVKAAYMLIACYS